VADSIARGFCSRHCAGNYAVVDGVDVPDPHHLSRNVGARALSGNRKPQSIHAPGAKLSADTFGRKPSRLARSGLFWGLRNREFCARILVVRANQEELRRCHLMPHVPIMSLAMVYLGTTSLTVPTLRVSVEGPLSSKSDVRLAKQLFPQWR
jgi:hypothetical protein